MRVLSVMTLLAVLVHSTVAFGDMQTLTATHTYILGDHDSKDDARQLCLLEAKRKILEQAGIYIESASEVKDFALTKDQITSFAAAVMQVKDTKEEGGFQHGHMTLKLTITATVDLAEVRKQRASRQVDASVRDDVAAQKERLKRLEAQLEAIQQQQSEQSFGHAPDSAPTDISAQEAQMWAWAAQGNVDAQYVLGTRYALGKGITQDYAKAREWFEKAAAHGHGGAQFALGAMYDRGQGVPTDYVTARKWFEQSAAQGDQGAQFALGAMYDKGHGVPQDYMKARGWYEQAAAQGAAAAQSNLGVLYDKGRGVPQDYAKARQWYEQAAAQGDAWAQSNLAALYRDGHGVPQYYAQAAYWYAKAAVQGNAEAQFFLGVLYGRGMGLPQDNVRAYIWYSLAAASTGAQQETAAGNRDEVARHLTPAQMAEARRLLNQCQAQQFKGCFS